MAAARTRGARWRACPPASRQDLIGERARDSDAGDRRVDGRLGGVDDEPRMYRDGHVGLSDRKSPGIWRHQRLEGNAVMMRAELVGSLRCAARGEIAGT